MNNVGPLSPGLPSLLSATGNGVCPLPTAGGNRPAGDGREGGPSPILANPRCRVYAMMPVDVVNEGPCLHPSRSPGLARSPLLTPVESRTSTGRMSSYRSFVNYWRQRKYPVRLRRCRLHRIFSERWVGTQSAMRHTMCDGSAPQQHRSSVSGRRRRLRRTCGRKAQSTVCRMLPASAPLKRVHVVAHVYA